MAVLTLSGDFFAMHEEGETVAHVFLGGRNGAEWIEKVKPVELS